MSTDLALFVLNASREYGLRVAQRLGQPPAAHEEREFEDGEHKSRPLESVRGRDAYIIQALYGDSASSVNDKLCRLLFFIAALRDAAARSVTAVIPYLCYARKDRRTQSRDPVTTRYVATLFEAVGVDRVLTLDVHNLAAYQNAFRCQTEHLEAKDLFVEHFGSLVGAEEVSVVAPDAGGIKRAEAFRLALSTRLNRLIEPVVLEKRRVSGEVSGERLMGDVAGRTAIILDDLISSGTTLRLAALACRAAGAKRVHAAATHGLFSARAPRMLGDGVIDSLVVTDTVSGSESASALPITVLDTSALVAEAVKRLHGNGSLSDLTSR